MSDDTASDGRPTEHGGGEAAPPIAGDPSSFPTDAELARSLVGVERRAALSTMAEGGYPFGSVVSYAVAADGAPVVLISEMAEHTVNARRDERSSMLVTASGGNDADPLSIARCTLVGTMAQVDDDPDIRERYLERHPYASYYVDFSDFGFWRLNVERIRYVGGFGHMSWVADDRYAAASMDPLTEAAADIVEHMNDDHADANLAYAQGLAGLTTATSASMVGIDRYGVTLSVATPEGQRMARVPFPSPLTGPDEARPAVVELLGVARNALAGDG
ncbi:MAG: DUF2470 domain-containing protein [Actinomycetota bacterium]